MFRMLVISAIAHAVATALIVALSALPSFALLRSKRPEKIQLRILGAGGPLGGSLGPLPGPGGGAIQGTAPTTPTPRPTPRLTPLPGTPSVIQPEELKRTPPPTPKPTETPAPTPAPPTPTPTPKIVRPAPKSSQTPKATASAKPTPTPRRTPEPQLTPEPPAALPVAATPIVRGTPYRGTPAPQPTAAATAAAPSATAAPGAVSVGGLSMAGVSAGAVSMGGGAGSGTGLGGVRGEPGELGLPAWYAVNSLRAIEGNFRSYQRANKQCRVRFTVLEDGTIKDAQVISSTGNRFLDDLALQALGQTRALPPLPDSVRARIKSLSLIVTFDFSRID